MGPPLQSRSHLMDILLPAKTLRRPVTGLFFLCLLLLFPKITDAHRIYQKISPDTLGTGDRFTYHLRITETDLYDKIIYPDSSAFGDDFLFHKKAIRSDASGDTLIYSLQYLGIDQPALPERYAVLIKGADTLYLTIPKLPLPYQSRVESTEALLRPLKPLFPFPFDRWPLVFLLILLFFALAFFAYRFREHFKKEAAPLLPPPPKPFENPFSLLENEISEIKKTFPDPSKEARVFYTRIGDAFRKYIERSHGFPALESTTSEVLFHLKTRLFPETTIRLLSQILQEADLVKFARRKPGAAEAQKVMGQACRLVNILKTADKQKIEALRRKHEERHAGIAS